MHTTVLLRQQQTLTQLNIAPKLDHTQERKALHISALHKDVYRTDNHCRKRRASIAAWVHMVAAIKHFSTKASSANGMPSAKQPQATGFLSSTCERTHIVSINTIWV